MSTKTSKRKIINKLIVENEPSANITISLIYIIASGLFYSAWTILQLGIFIVNKNLTHIVLLGNGSLFLIFAIISIVLKGKPRWIKYVFITLAIVAALSINMMTGFKTWLLFALPLIISVRYFDTLLTIIMGILSSSSIIVGAFINAYILPEYFDLIDLNTVSYSHYTVLSTVHSLYQAVLESDFDSNVVLSNTLSLLSAPNIVIIFILTFACVSIVKYGQNLIYEENVKSKKQSEMQLEIEKDKQKIMMSQIQPHFLYNCLSTIMAVDNNPPETVEALGEFGKYLRENLDSLTSDELVPFNQEMQHVKRYISLEELRFKENLNVVYNIRATNFLIPIMTIQMLAENAIKHGITKKENGGTLKISTLEADNEYQVIIEDDGVGFEEKDISKDRNHVGLNSTKNRVETFCGGSIDIDSKLGVGTKITVHIPKGEQ